MHVRFFMRKYHIFPGSEVVRYTYALSAVRPFNLKSDLPENLSSETIVTTKHVIFDNDDVEGIVYEEHADYPGVPDLNRPEKYTFRLPESAEPWKYLTCRAEFVQTMDVETENE